MPYFKNHLSHNSCESPVRVPTLNASEQKIDLATKINVYSLWALGELQGIKNVYIHIMYRDSGISKFTLPGNKHHSPTMLCGEDCFIPVTWHINNSKMSWENAC